MSASQITSAPTSLPVAVIGGGPVGITAAAHLAARRLPFVVLEAGDSVGAAVSEWAHVRMFSPWRYTIDATAAGLLESSGWQRPPDDALPTGADLVAHYVKPLAMLGQIAPFVRFNARVISVGRKDLDKVRSKDRDARPFELRLESGEVIEARAVIDASGTWRSPNPIGSGGNEATGERQSSAQIAYGIPDVLDRDRSRYANKTVAVVGSGHSAFNVILDLITLTHSAPTTQIAWLMRRENLDTVWGGGAADELRARGELGARAKAAAEAGLLSMHAPFLIRSVERSHEGRLLLAGGTTHAESVVEADEVIVCTGFRPDLDMLREVRLGLDPLLECPSVLGPLIDPNEHSCGTVKPHGARELAHPEKDFYIVGMKSYGRAPTFLLATGFEQVRSVVAMIDGDVAAAERVQLVLPETGVCSTDLVGGSCCGATAPQHELVGAGDVASADCCGGPAPSGVEACCADDADAKAEGAAGCGCNAPTPVLQISRRVKQTA
jgi:thioredoxin reductase